MIVAVEFKGYERVELKLAKIEQAGVDLDRHLLQFAYKVSAIAKQHTPVDTGRLRASIFAKLAGRHQAEVGTNVHYAPYVEIGHNPIILPVRAKALRFYIRGVGDVFAKRVEQGRAGQKSGNWLKEGGKIRKPFLQPALKWAKNNIVNYFRKVMQP